MIKRWITTIIAGLRWLGWALVRVGGRVKAFAQRHSTVEFLIGLLVVSLALTWWSFVYMRTFSVFTVVIAMFAVMLILGVLTDRYILPGIDTLKEIKEGNIAVAITILALAVLFLACVSLV